MTEDDLIPELGHLVIADLDFIIDSASISESVDSDGQRRWDLMIDTHKRTLKFGDGPFDSFKWAPNIRGDSVRVQAPPLDSIVGQTISIPDAYDSEFDEHLFSMYIFSHEDVYDSKVRFLERQGDTLRVEWRGKCNIHFDSDKYGEAVPFALLADVKQEP